MLIILFFAFLLIELPKSSQHLHKYLLVKKKNQYSVCNLEAFIKFIVMELCTTQGDLYVLLYLDAWLQNPHVTNMHTFQQ